MSNEHDGFYRWDDTTDGWPYANVVVATPEAIERTKAIAAHAALWAGEAIHG